MAPLWKLLLSQFICVLISLAVSGSLQADTFTFVLQGGGQIEGEWLNAKDRSQKDFLVSTQGGGKILLKRSQVKDLVRQPVAELEYQRIAPTFGDSVEEQWRLAEWCLERRLVAHRTAHLRRIVELDPDHTKARHGLGFTQIDGKWMTRQQRRKADGYVRYRGKWRMAQEVELMEVRDKKERAEREWMGKLKRWREALETERAAAAQRQILAIKDKDAVRALREKLKSEPMRRVKLMYVDVLGQIESNSAAITLINTSLNDPDVEVFHACVDQIVRSKTSLAVPAYIKALRDPNNVRINRAGTALEQLNDPEAIAPLIEALVTTHHLVIASANVSSGTPVSTSFVSPGGAQSQTQVAQPSTGAEGNPFSSTGLSSNNQPQVISRRVPNNQVLYALVKLSGGTSFGFDQKAWENWLNLERSKSKKSVTRNE